jgi:hypothetical protein
VSDTAAGSATGSADDPVPGSGDPVAVGTKGGGEWPSPSGAPPTGAAPGSDPERAAELREQRKEHTTSGDGTSAGELHPPARLSSAYEQQPDAAAVGSTPVTGDRAEGQPVFESESAGEPEPARDAGAARHRAPQGAEEPSTDQL